MVYDLIVIGGGPAGYRGAERAAESGMNVLLFEKQALGGVCLNEGCIPTKTILNSAKIYEMAAHGEAYGVTAADVKMDHSQVIKRKKKVVRKLVAGVAAQLKAAKVQVIPKTAVITGRTDDGFTVTCEGDLYTAQRLLITTGSLPVTPPIPGVKEGLDSGFIMTNREMLDLEKLPQQMIVIGGGVIGLEMAAYCAIAGVKIHIIEMLDHIAGATDQDISSLLKKKLEERGVEFHLGAKVTSVTDHSVIFEQDEKTCELACDKVLLSIGRRAQTAGFGLETLGVLTDRTGIVTDEHCRTGIAGVWAAGDVNGRSMLAHTAYREAEVAVADMLGKRDYMRYDAIPAVIYTKPEVACVGMTPMDAQSRSMDVEVVQLPLSYSGRYVAEEERGDGFAKILFDKKTRRLLGVHMIGSYASEIIWGAASMMENEYRVSDIRQVVFPHPTVSEIIREAAFMAEE